MRKPRFEPYDDNSFNKFIHDYDQYDLDRRTYWSEQYTSDHNRDAGGYSYQIYRGYSYQIYLKEYDVIDKQGLLLPSQKPKLREAEFEKCRKRLIDLNTVKNPSEKISRQINALADKVLFTPLQMYEYERYRFLYQEAKKANQLIAAHGALMSEDEFVEMKKALLGILDIWENKREQFTEVLIKQEREIHPRLFPPIED